MGGQRDGRERRGVTGPERGWAAAEHTREMGRPGLRPERGKERGNGEQKTELGRGERQAEQAFGPGMRGRVFPFFYFIFKTKFKYEPKSNSNGVSNTLFTSIRIEKFW